MSMIIHLSWYDLTYDRYMVAHRLDISFRQIPVQFPQVEEGECHANDVDDDPKDIEYIMTKGAMHQRAARCIVAALCVCR